MKLEFSGQILEKPHIRFPENPSSASGIDPWGPADGQPDITKYQSLLAILRTFLKLRLLKQME